MVSGRLKSTACSGKVFDTRLDGVAHQQTFEAQSPVARKGSRPEVAMHWSHFLDFVAAFLYEHHQVSLVPLVQTCTFFRSWFLKVLEQLDNTIRPALQTAGAWSIGRSDVALLVRWGRRARRSQRRGRAQPLDLEFLCDLGYLPEDLLLTMQSDGTTFRLAPPDSHCLRTPSAK